MGDRCHLTMTFKTEDIPKVEKVEKTGLHDLALPEAPGYRRTSPKRLKA